MSTGGPVVKGGFAWNRDATTRKIKTSISVREDSWRCAQYLAANQWWRRGASSIVEEALEAYLSKKTPSALKNLRRAGVTGGPLAAYLDGDRERRGGKS